MSLIIKMLKDLEKRENKHREVPSIALTQPLPAQDKAYFRYRHILLGLGLTGLIVISIFWLNRHLPLPIPSVRHKTLAKQAVTTKDANDNSAWTQLVNITGVTVQVKENITEISFMLDHPALYRLDTDNMQNQLAVIIEDAQFQSQLPPVAYLNTAIQNISAKNDNGNVRFNLTLIAGASVKYVNLTDDVKNPELVVSIQNQSDSNSLEMTSDKLVKTPAMQTLLSRQYETALSIAKNGDTLDAITRLRSLLKVDSGYKNARVSLAALLLNEGNQSGAKNVIDEGLNFTPDYSPLIELKARILTNEGKVHSALTLLQSESPPIADNPDYHELMAALYERENNHLISASIYRQLLQTDPHNSRWWLGLGIALDKLGKSNGAIEAYTKAAAEGRLNAQAMDYLQNRLNTLQGLENDKG